MRLKYIVLSIVSAVFIFLLIFFLNGFIIHTPPAGLNLSISENISPNIDVFILNTDRKAVSSVDLKEAFFFQQMGLSKGTAYGFRVIDEHNSVIMPVYETFIAKTSDWIESNKYYHGLAVGKYRIELLIIKDGIGTIVARTNLSVLNLELERENLDRLIRNNCSPLTAEPVVDADGWSRDSKISGCITDIAVEFKDPYACKSLFLSFNLSLMVYEDCIRNYAIATGDISACDLNGMPKSRGFCNAKVTKDWTECRKISCDLSCAMESLETQQDLCIQWYAIENKNASLCNELKSTAYNMKEVCLNITTRNEMNRR